MPISGSKSGLYISSPISTQDFLSSIILSREYPKYICGNLLNLSKYGALGLLECVPVDQNPPQVKLLNLVTTLGLHPLNVEAS